MREPDTAAALHGGAENARMITRPMPRTGCLAPLTLCLAACAGVGSSPVRPISADIQQVLDKPMYRNAVWGLRVVDRDTGAQGYQQIIDGSTVLWTQP